VEQRTHFGKMLAVGTTMNWRQVMKKTLKKHRMSNRYDSPLAFRHIDFLRIRAFADQGINFTEEETGHFDLCRACRLKVIDALRSAPSLIPVACEITLRKAA
jgi:hypothetical protein